MNRREVKSFNRVFSIEPLITYRGNPLFNVNYLAVAFLYDFPNIAGNPMELRRVIERWKLNKTTSRDRVIIEVLKKRLSSFNEGKKMANMI
jgi:hypothetical protein